MRFAPLGEFMLESFKKDQVEIEVGFRFWMLLIWIGLKTNWLVETESDVDFFSNGWTSCEVAVWKAMDWGKGKIICSVYFKDSGIWD